MTGLADAVIARILRQRDLIQVMDEHCRSISATVTSRDKHVSVEVDGYGAMTGLSIGPDAYRLGAGPLGALIVDTARAAAKVAAERQAYLTEQFGRRMRDLQMTPLPHWDGTTFEFKPE